MPGEETTQMTVEDLQAGHARAQQLIDMVTDMRPPAAVAALALALASTTHLAKCGPDAAMVMFRDFFRRLGALAASQP